MKLRIIILTLCLIISYILINPSFSHDGVSIIGVNPTGYAAQSGFVERDVSLTHLERILEINGQPVSSLEDYYAALTSDSLLFVTAHNTYAVVINETYPLDANESIEHFRADALGLTISEPHVTNIRKGLDLEGGSRILLRPVDNITAEEYQLLQENIEKRLNIYGLTDVQVSTIKDSPFASTPSFLRIEIAGTQVEDIIDVISKQGVFEAKIANQTTFTGADVLSAGASTRVQSGVDLASCRLNGEQYSCRFSFPISLSLEAAKRQAEITDALDVIGSPVDGHLSEPLELYLDDVLVDTLQIQAGLKGSSVTQISITGGGFGNSQAQAQEQAHQNMIELQTILKTGSLPSKLEVVSSDTISAGLGHAFIVNAFFIGGLAALIIAILVYVRYRLIKIVIPILLTSFSEVLILLGFAALVGWNIDLSAIAGIIIILGTGLDHQVIIADELLSKETQSFKLKRKKALGIILIAYATTIVAMIPLMFAGAGLLKGFALTTIVGVTIGILITRPAFAQMAEWAIEKEKH